MSLYMRLCSLVLGGSVSAWAFENSEVLERVIDWVMRDPAHCCQAWLDEDNWKSK